MKFVSWNVNGLRACIGKGFFDTLSDFDADFFCMQETKMQPDQLTEPLNGYHAFWNSAEKKGYSGTLILAKQPPLRATLGLSIPEHDTEGRVVTLEYEDFFLVNCYTPNAQRELARLDYRLAWDAAFRDYLCALDAQKPVILCGDLNVAHTEIDLKNPKSNVGNAGFSPQERASFTQLLSCGFADTFRRLHPDTTGAYTWWSYMFQARKNNAGWRIDYFLASERLMPHVVSADIHADIIGSDHCPVSLTLAL